MRLIGANMQAPIATFFRSYLRVEHRRDYGAARCKYAKLPSIVISRRAMRSPRGTVTGRRGAEDRVCVDPVGRGLLEP
jgi:hypothetical protein